MPHDVHQIHGGEKKLPLQCNRPASPNLQQQIKFLVSLWNAIISSWIFFLSYQLKLRYFLLSQDIYTVKLSVSVCRE